MGNNLNAVNKAGSAGGALAIGAVIGTPIVIFGGMVSYLTLENLGMNGWTGPGGMVAAAGTATGLVIAHRASNSRRERRAAERAWSQWLRYRAEFPPETHYALDILTNDLQACLMWTHPQIGIGTPPNQMTAGTYPRLLPGQDPGHTPDPGMRISPVGARIRLQLPPGFSADHVRAKLPAIASSLHVPRVQVVKAAGDHVMTIELRVRNPLAASKRFEAPEPSPVPLKELRVGIREDGEYYRIRIWNNHLFLAGLTGSGKSGVLWSIIGALAPDIQAGRVELHMIDLKRGTEMAAGYRLYSSWAYQVSEALDVLVKLVRIMRNRADPRREHAMRTGQAMRNHEPTPGDPHHVLMIDEIIALIKLVGDRKGTFEVPQIDGTWEEETIRVDKYVVILLLELLSQARAFGISIIVATQNAAKDIFDLLRDMFPVRIGLRQASEQQVQMVYGTGAADRGIEATAITVDEAGTAFIDSPETGGQAQRVRFFLVENIDIEHLVRIFGRPEGEAPPTVDAHPGADDTDDEENVVDLDKFRQDEDQEDEGEQEPDDGIVRCKFCNEPVTQTPGKRRKEYCSPNHRTYYFREQKKKAQGGN